MYPQPGPFNEPVKLLGEKMTENKIVELEIRKGIAYITINRPKAMNALNPETVAQLDEQFSAAEKDASVRGIVFQGAGKAFVAGADIKFFLDNIKNNRLEDTEAFTRKGHDLLLRIENCAVPTIALLDGLSLGGGSEMALACQAIVATPDGCLGFPETSIGIFPGLGGMIRSARQIGTDLAKYYVFTGKMIKANDAADLGLFTRLVAPEEVEAAIEDLCSDSTDLDKYRDRKLPDRFAGKAATCSKENVSLLLKGEKPAGVADELAEKTAKIISVKAPLALKLANELIDAQHKVSIPEAIELELSKLHYIFSTEDALAGLASVGQKPPQYKGK